MLSLPFILLLILVGCLSGIVAGLLGLGGGIIMTPICSIIYPYLGVNPVVLSHVIFGTNLFVASFSSLLSAFRYHIRNLVLWRAVFPIGIFSIIGGLAGSTIAAHLSSQTLLRFFGVFVLFAAVRMYYEFKSSDHREPIFNLPVLAFTGICTAFITVMIGLGGGSLTIPVMVLILHYPVRNVPGTSSGIIIFTAVAGMIGYIINGRHEPLIPDYSLGYVYLAAGIPLMLGAMLGVPLGTWINSKTSTKRIRQIFGIVLFVVGIKMIFFTQSQ
ncbi:hypothetical protein AMJ80_12235 [bacterium SM23_31]|nr:MAG: hypothetical protein AMJ80_12235 [bacterium SM23_31]